METILIVSYIQSRIFFLEVVITVINYGEVRKFKQNMTEHFPLYQI